MNARDWTVLQWLLRVLAIGCFVIMVALAYFKPQGDVAALFIWLGLGLIAGTLSGGFAPPL